MKKRVSSHTVSSDVVNYLIAAGHTQKQLADVLGVDRSYISHVAKGSRNLIVTDLERLAKMQGVTLPELLVKATPITSVPQEMREGYRLFLQGIRAAEEARASLARRPRTRRAVAV